MAVPSASVPALLKDIKAIAEKYNTESAVVGHIADGNVHNFIMLKDGKLPDYADNMRNDMYAAALKYGGTITAEHGTGKTRIKHMHQQYTAREIEIMKGIKRAFDPNNILNPGTIVD
jgi:glycolate oxidase